VEDSLLNSTLNSPNSTLQTPLSKLHSQRKVVYPLKRRLAICLLALALCASPARSEAVEVPANLSGDEVRALEDRLHALGYLAAEADSAYDADTRQALESFQQANGLIVTGRPDDDTRARLDGDAAISRQDYLRRFAQTYQDMEPLQNGNVNSQVQAMQQRLIEYGYFTGQSDGVFGDATQMAIQRFQMVNGLPVTGIADGMTLMRLMADVPISWQGYLSEMSCAAGDVGLNVYVLQRRLRAMGYFEGECTGSFGDLTQRAVAAFQTDNALEATGAADAGLWELIYSGAAVTRRRLDALAQGDTGVNVTQIQQQLNALGYYAQEASGSFDCLTETALRLFQMASGMPNTGLADNETIAALMSDAARPLADPAAQEMLAALMNQRGPELQGRIAAVAREMVGRDFPFGDDPLYPGFALVQYVCAAAGLPVTDPESLIRLASAPVSGAEDVQPGNIVALQTSINDNVTMLLAIGDGDGRLIYSTPEIGWVVMSYIDQMDSDSAYRWAESES